MDWISVKDRLPEPNKRVLVCTNRLDPLFSKKRKVKDRGVVFVDILFEYPSGNFFWDCRTYYEVTHWMPLPNPPDTN